MNIAEPIRRVAQLFPGAQAVFHFGKIVTYGELNGVIDALAARMLGMGLRPGDAAGVLVSNGYGHVVLTLALARIGAAAVTSRAVIEGVGGVSLKICFVDAGPVTGALANCVTVDDGWWSTPSNADQVPSVPSHPDSKAICLVVSSSGTTGFPKAMALSHDIMRTRVFVRWLAIPVPYHTRQICTLGLESHYGFSSILRVLWTGGLAVTAISWTDIHAVISRHQINCLVMSPAQLHMLLEVLPEEAGPFPSLDAIEIGGSTLPPRLAVQAKARLCPNIYSAYGAAEAGNMASAPLSVLERYPSAVGFISPGIEAQAVDADHRPLPAGIEGIIRIRSENCIDAYLGDPEASAKAFEDGWFYPGDAGSVSSNGLLAISGRTTEMINIWGVKVSPQAIEDVVLTNPEIREAAAFAMLNVATNAQEIWVAIVQKTPVNMDALYAYCVERLGPRAPKSILLVNALPRNENGKLLREQLVGMATAASRIAGERSGRP